MATLVVLSDTGSSVMFYGGLLAMLYVATNRVSFVVIGLLGLVTSALLQEVERKVIPWKADEH